VALNIPNGYGVEEIYAIYLDADTQNVEVDNNTLINVCSGLYINNAKNNTFRNNKVYNIQYAGMYLKSQGGTYPSTGNTITGNEFYSLAGNMIRFTGDNVVGSLGTINNNKYVKPNGGVLFDRNFGAQTYTTIAAWNASTGYDTASTATPTASTVSNIYTNLTPSTVSTDIGTSRISMVGAILSSPQNILSFESLIVLEGDNPIPPVGLSFKRNYSIVA
jgi:parallel beta-helix repeat protein